MKIDLGWAHIELLPGAPYSVHHQASVPVIGLAFERQRGVHAIADGCRVDFDAWPGDMALTWPEVAVFSESAQGGEYLTLQVQGDDHGGMPWPVHGAPRQVWQGHRQAWQVGAELRRLLLAPGQDDGLIELHAAQLHAVAQEAWSEPGMPPSRYAMDRAAHARVMAHVDEVIHDDPTGPSLRLQALAQVAGMPLLRFLRSFSHTVGCTPHAYVTDRKVQRARALLRDTSMRIVDIAASCGFSHQSHLGAAFKMQLGMSPAQYRREQLGVISD